MDKQIIIDFLTTHKAEMQALFGVVKIGLFGSYARGQQTAASDIDIAVELESDNTFRSFFNLKEYLESQLHTPVDLGIESAIKPIAKQHIQKEIIYA